MLGAWHATIDTPMRQGSSRRLDVAVEDPLDMNQATLARAIAPVLERRDQDRLQTVGLTSSTLHPTRRVSVTPSGRSVALTTTR
jgi:hypothetical protein